MAKGVKCRDCNNLKHHWCERVIDSPDEDMLRDCQYFWQKTNADRIRAMSDEELAKWLCSISTAECCDRSCPARDICHYNDNGMIKWVKQPVED